MITLLASSVLNVIFNYNRFFHFVFVLFLLLLLFLTSMLAGWTLLRNLCIFHYENDKTVWTLSPYRWQCYALQAFLPTKKKQKKKQKKRRNGSTSSRS